MSAVLQHVRRTIVRHGLCPSGTRVLVGLSGGGDSVALALVLRELAGNGRFTVAAAAHLNHQLRPTAIRDEQFCRELASRLVLPIIVESRDVRAFGACNGLSTEEAARRLRYDFLEQAAREIGADRIAVGHTEDDQAETYLLKLVRGAGLAALGGVYPQRGIVVRPLLEVSRNALRDYLRSLRQDWVEDESNQDIHNPRNRIRHRVIPELDRVAGAAASPAIARAAALAREDGTWLDELAERRLGDLMTRTPEGLELPVADLAREPLPVRRRVLRLAMRAVADGRQVELEHVEVALALLAGLRGSADFPGSRMELRREKLVLLDMGGVSSK